MDGIALAFAVAGIVFVFVALVGIAGYLIDKGTD